MHTISFNNSLLTCLPDLLGVSVNKLAADSGLQPMTLGRFINRGDIISVQLLLKLCNAIRVPISYFFSEGDTRIIPEREHATIPASIFQPAAWDLSTVERTFGDQHGQIFWKDIAATMHVSDQKGHERFALRVRLPVTDFIAVCNAYHLHPSHFFINFEQPSVPGSALGRNATSPPKRQPSRSPIPSTLLADIDALRHDLSSALEEIALLRKEIHTLRAAHDTLERRVGVNIEHIQDSHLSIVAEPTSDYGAKLK